MKLSTNTWLAQTLMVLFLGSMLVSCVPNRKYQEEVSAKQSAQREAANAKTAQKKLQEEIEALEKDFEVTKKDLKDLREDYDLLEQRYNQQQRLNKDLQSSYDKLLALNEKLKEEASSKRLELSEELKAKRQELERKEMLLAEKDREMRKREREIEELEAKMKQERAELEKLQGNVSSLEENKSELEESLREREARVKELEAAIAAREAKNEALRQKLNDALRGFDASDLSVEKRNGKIYVSLSQNLLFASGSAKLDKGGVDALEKLADVLVKNKDISIMVEGHTDSDGSDRSNWVLSTNRALSIVYQLTSNNVEPERITAAGRGEHLPVASNETEEGQARNRRTEIILSPNLKEIFEILEE